MTEKPSPPDPTNRPARDDQPAAAEQPAAPEPAQTDSAAAASTVAKPSGVAQPTTPLPPTASATADPPTEGFDRPAPGYDQALPRFDQPRRPVERLQRSSSDRLLAGVCGGLGRHFGVDPILFRVGFVALVFAAGTGILLYIALAILMPSDDGQQLWQRGSGQRSGVGPPADGDSGSYQPLVPKGPRSPVPGVTLAVLLIGLGVVALAERFGDWSLDPSAYFAIAVAIVGVGLLVSAFGPWRRSKAGLITLGVFLSFGLFVSSAVDDRGGFDRATFGEHNYRPASVSEVNDTYEVLMGQSTLDLSGVEFTGEDPTRIDIQVTMGEFRILVPRDVDVALHGDAAFGEVSVFGNRNGSDGYYPGVGDSPNAGDDEPELIVNFDVRFGSAEVQRVG